MKYKFNFCVTVEADEHNDCLCGIDCPFLLNNEYSWDCALFRKELDQWKWAHYDNSKPEIKRLESCRYQTANW